ncbi:T9SS type A sorting domain-containing protein [Pontimicrobium sp. IMCC45349]|uniref:T9SS type A sorting domain-containing protein n=1 Tax=Pontimicrobium sp. IMCC45349 TaxID=3391574 RepID=UPI00399F2C60
MKKTTLLFFVALLSSYSLLAQHTFGTQAGPYSVVADDGPVTVGINDVGNTAAAPAGNYDTFIVTVDWVDTNNAWSSEADLTVTTTAGSVTIDPATSGAGSSGAATTMTFEGTLAGVYTPETDGFLEVALNQSYAGSSADWTNISVQIIPALTCTPAAATTTVVPDCANTQFSVDVDVTDLGDSGTLTIANDAGVASTDVTAIGIVTVGPFPDATNVVITLQHETDPLCNVDMAPVVNVCPPTNDECVDAIALACDDVIVSDTSLATDSGYNASSDVWYSYTGTGLEDVTLALCNSNYDTYIRVFEDCAGTNEIGNDDSCGTRSEVTFTSDGVTTYYILVEGYATNAGVFELTVSCAANIPPPANDDCGAATPLTLGVELFGETNAGATQSAGDQPTCDSFGFIADVWYSFVAPASGEVTIQTTLGTADNANVAVYDDCANLDANAIGACTDDVGAVNADYTGLTPGATYYVKVWNDGALPPPTAGRVEGSFDILASDTTLSIGGVEGNNAFEYFPNPVNDKLSLRAQNNIQNVVVFNMLGQQVIRTSPNLTSSDVDMSALQAGAYFVQITIEDKTETIRIIRK